MYDLHVHFLHVSVLLWQERKSEVDLLNGSRQDEKGRTGDQFGGEGWMGRQLKGKARARKASKKSRTAGMHMQDCVDQIEYCLIMYMLLSRLSEG